MNSTSSSELNHIWRGTGLAGGVVPIHAMPAVPTTPLTKAVVAMVVSFAAPDCVGAVGDPVSAGDASGAFAARSVTRLVMSACAMGTVGGNVEGLPLMSAHAVDGGGGIAAI